MMMLRRSAHQFARYVRPNVLERPAVTKSLVGDWANNKVGKRTLATKGKDDAFVFEVNADNFQEKVLQSDVPVILDCYANWCGPCRVLGPILEKHVRAENGKVVMAKLDTDQEPHLTQSLDVSSLPTVMTVFNGELLDQFIGAQPDNVVKDFVKRAVAANPPK